MTTPTPNNTTSSSTRRNWARITWKPTALASRILPPSLLEFFNKVTSQRHDVAPIQFPQVPSRLTQLLELGLSQDHANSLCGHFVDAVRKTDETLSALYYNSAPQLCSNLNPLMARSTYVEVIQQHLLRVRAQAVEQLWSTLLTRATENLPNDRNPSPSTSSLPINGASSNKRKRQGRPSTFTSEQTFALNALLARDDQYSSEEKEFIAQKLNLTRDQVNRWFCNARARKNTGARAASRAESPASVRTVSSDLTTAESYQSDQGTSTPEVTSSTPGLNDSSPAFTIATPVTNPDLIDPATSLTDATPQIDSLDVYLNYSTCLDPEQGPTSSAVESQPALTSVPNDAPLFADLQESHGQFFDDLNFSSFQPLPTSPPESHLSNDLFPNFDLSHW